MTRIKAQPPVLTDAQTTLLINLSKMYGVSPNDVLEQVLKPLADDKDFLEWRSRQNDVPAVVKPIVRRRPAHLKPASGE